MENASKALIIAASALLLILMMSFTTYMFRKIGGDASDIYGELKDSDIAEFNQQFLNYADRGTQKDAENKWINPLKIQDVVSIINLAKSNNESRKMPVEIKVKVDGTQKQNSTTEDLRNMLKDNIGNEYSCKVKYGTSNLRLVETIEINTL